MILSGAMMLEWLGETREAPELSRAGEDLRRAVGVALAEGAAKTPDLGGAGLDRVIQRGGDARAGGAADVTFRVIVIGAGYFAGFHVEAWLRMPGAALVGLVDLDVARAEAQLRAQGGDPASVEISADAGALLERLAPDIIDIAAPPTAHRALIELALASPAQAIICQKPFCGGLEGARAAMDRIAPTGRLVVVHENFRFQPWYRALKAELEAGRVGEVYQITFRLRPGDGQGPDAYLSRQPYFQQMPRFLVHETAIHWVDTFRYLLGEPSAVFADLRPAEPGDRGRGCGGAAVPLRRRAPRAFRRQPTR